MYLTKRQSELLDYLRKTIAVQGYAPSLEEMAAHFKLSSVGTVHKHLKALEEKGVIRRQWNRSRAIEIVDAPDGAARRLPVLGSFVDGQPVGTVHGAESVAVPEDILGRGKAYVLVVKGDGSSSDSLCDGDYLVVQQREDAAPGDLVLVSLGDNRVRLRRWSPRGQEVRLEAANDPSRVETHAASSLSIQGVVLGIQRRFR